MKKLIAILLIFSISLSCIGYASDSNSTASYIKKQKLDAFGILSLYSAGESLKGIELDYPEDSNITTDYESYLISAAVLGNDLSKASKALKNCQLENGKFADYIGGKGEELVNAHIWAIISLYCAGDNDYNRKKAFYWLKKQQNADGGFPIYSSEKNSDVDLTAMAIVAYKALGLKSESKEIKNALNFVHSNLYKRESCESIAWYIIARKTLGLAIDKSLYDNLDKYRLSDGSYAHIMSQRKSNYMASWHGLLATSDYNNKESAINMLRKNNTKK